LPSQLPLSSVSLPLHPRTKSALHRISAGFNGLNFEPQNVVAEIGDLIEFHFLPKVSSQDFVLSTAQYSLVFTYTETQTDKLQNHTVVQSSFDKPCEPLANSSGAFSGVFSGFNFATMQGEAKDVFTFQVQSKDPFWYYCSQTVGNHCQMGKLLLF
jgi:hypothetical protein